MRFFKNNGFLNRIRKISNFISYFIRAEKRWSWPSKSDVLIFDACGEELLREYLLESSMEVLPVRGEWINIPVVLASLFVPGRKSDAYFDVYIRKVHPKLIITFIDNSLAFCRLSQRHTCIKTMFIQNGWRGYHADIFEQLDMQVNSTHNLSVDYMLCFGSAVGRHYQRYISGLVIPMGSLRNNRQIHLAPKIKNSLAYVSQWLRHGIQMGSRSYSQDEFIGVADRNIVGFLGEYAREKSKHLFIIPRSKFGSPDRADEAEYFASILGEACHFLEYDSSGSSYKAIDAAEVVVGVDSTLLYESIARGTKTAIFSIRGNITNVNGFDFGWPAYRSPVGSFWTNTPSHVKYREVLDFLFGISVKDWRDELNKASFTDLMIMDLGNSILKKIITQVLAT